MKKQYSVSFIMLVGVVLSLSMLLTGCDTGSNDAPVINANAMDSSSAYSDSASSSDQSDEQNGNTVVVPTDDIQVVNEPIHDQSMQSRDNSAGQDKTTYHERVHRAHHLNTENTADDDTLSNTQHHSTTHHNKMKKALRSGWPWPASGSLTATFSTAHPGIEIQGDASEAITAVDGGTVVYSQNNVNRYGNMVIIDHGNHVMTAYAYNETLLVQAGDQVMAGQKIATMGKNLKGDSCVYFEVRHNGKPVNPFNYLSKTP